jgi:hypothetical protein
MTDAIEAGARSIYDHEPIVHHCEEISWGDVGKGIQDRYKWKARLCIDAAIASGALVPASAVAKALDAYRFYIDASDQELAERNMTRADALLEARLLDPYDGNTPTAESVAHVPASAVAEMRERCLRQARASLDLADAISAIRQLDLAPASGDYVVVPKKALLILAERGEGWPSNEYVKAIDEIEAMLNAAGSNGGEK